MQHGISRQLHWDSELYRRSPFSMGKSFLTEMWHLRHWGQLHKCAMESKDTLPWMCPPYSAPPSLLLPIPKPLLKLPLWTFQPKCLPLPPTLGNILTILQGRHISHFQIAIPFCSLLIIITMFSLTYIYLHIFFIYSLLEEQKSILGQHSACTIWLLN